MTSLIEDLESAPTGSRELSDRYRARPIGAVPKSAKKRFWKRVRKTPDCWIWTGHLDKRRYGRLWIENKAYLAPRVSWAIAHGRLPSGLSVLHHCDNPPCVNPDHLFLGTHKDNMADMVQKGRSSRITGSRHHRAKLTEIRVREILHLSEDGVTRRELAERFNVSRTTIARIVTRRTWTHV